MNTYSRSRHRKGLQYTHTTRVPFASRAARAAAGSAAGGLAASHAATLPSRGTIRPPLLVGCVASVLVAMNTLDGHLWQGQGYHRKLVRVHPGTKAGMAQGVSGYLGDLGGFFVCCRGSHGFGCGRAHIRGGSRARLGQMRRSPITFSISTSEALVRVLRQSDTQRARVSHLHDMQ